ncbi:MAG: type IX secretion system outer membrane channel protein PorV [Flavobacteriales bacterium]|nr:type IX secretion system outer membrane channel protein PorV [Flavobacteriales bacterium]
MKLHNTMRLFSFLMAGIFISANTYSQNTQSGGTDFSLQLNTITTAVPFLLIAPDSRASAMGDLGAATNGDINSQHWNASKYVFAEQDGGVAFSYSPWLRNLGINDINLVYLVGYKKLDKNSAISGSMRYFSLGSITFTDVNGGTIKEANPKEFALDAAYSTRLGKNLSGAFTARYINSNLTEGLTANGVDTKPGRSIAVDLSAFYKGGKFDLGEYDANLNIGMNISNVGAKISYTNSSTEDFLPANLRLGTVLNIDIDKYNDFAIGVDFNKLLVPSPPQRGILTNEIVAGRDNNVGVASGIFGSFSDAPGNALFNEQTNEFEGVEDGSVFIEELREVNISVGMEYTYAEKFAVRAGYFHEHYTKGNRRFITMGIGLEYSKLELDISYLVSLTNNSPLANTIRFSLGFNFASNEE